MKYTEYLVERLTESQKRANDFETAREIMDHHIPAFNSASSLLGDYEKDRSNYNLINNIIQEDELEEICNPLGLEEGYFEDQIMPYNKIPAKLNLILGEEIKRNEDFSAILLDDSSVMDKDVEIAELWYEYAEAETNKTLTRIQLENEGATEEEIQAQIEKITSKYNPEEIAGYKTALEMFANTVIDYARAMLSLKEKKNNGFKHAMITDKEAVYVGMEHGFPQIEPVNMLHFFAQKGPEVDNYEDGDWAGRRMLMTISQVQRAYGNLMTDKQLADLLSYAAVSRKQPFKVRGGMIAPDHYDRGFGERWAKMGGGVNSNFERNVGQYGDTNNSNYFQEDLIWVTHFTWKWERKIGFLTSYDQFGEGDTIIVDSEYEAPPGAETIEFINRWGMRSKKKVWFNDLGLRAELEEMWIPRVWEGTRIGSDIYVNIREIPHQPVNVNNPFYAKLPYIGKTYSAMNAEIISPVARMKPFNVLYMVVMHMLVKMIARNYGAVIQVDTSMIDPALGDGDPQLALERTLIYMREGIQIYNSLKDAYTDRDVMSGRPSTGVVSYSNTQDILNLINLLSWLDREIGMGFGITPEREGNFQAYSNVTDNRQVLVQSSNITEIYFYKHNIIWQNVLEYFVNMFRLWAKDQLERNPDVEHLQLRYLLPNGNPAVLKVNRDVVDHGQIGIYITNYGAETNYYATMEQLALTFVQNDRATLEDISMLMKARINGTSPEEVHKMIVEMEKKKFEQQSQSSQAQQQGIEDAYKKQQEMAELEHEHKMAEIRLEKTLEGEIKLSVEEIKSENNNSAPTE